MTRELVILVLAIFITTRTSPTQAQNKEVRIGVIGAPEEPRFSDIVSGLKKGLGDLGYAPPSLVVYETKIARAEEKNAKPLIESLLKRKAQVLFLIGSRLLQPVREVSAQVPVVFITPGDPVAAGLVASLSRPAGNSTAMTFEYPELSGKRLALLKEVTPKVRSVLAVYDPRDPSPKQGIMAAREAAPRVGVSLIEREARNRDELLRALGAVEESDAYLSIPGGFPTAAYGEITSLINSKRLPTIFHVRQSDTMDALTSYGASDTQVAHDSARLVDKIIKGANAGELPVERPTKIELTINLRTAKRIGVAIPPNVLARADRVIK
jgi:putative tryptophan/tyrosine transport system substrate-binding protein